MVFREEIDYCFWCPNQKDGICTLTGINVCDIIINHEDIPEWCPLERMGADKIKNTCEVCIHNNTYDADCMGCICNPENKEATK